MHVAHTNLAPLPEKKATELPKKPMSPSEQFAYEMAYKGWQKALKKHAAIIEEIREVFPDFKIEFEYKPKKA